MSTINETSNKKTERSHLDLFVCLLQGRPLVVHIRVVLLQVTQRRDGIELGLEFFPDMERKVVLVVRLRGRREERYEKNMRTLAVDVH